MRQDDRAAFDRALHGARVSAYAPGEFVGQESFMTAGEIRALAVQAGIGPGVTVLDLCCGVAGPGRFLTRELGCAYLGVDSNASAVAIARGRASDLPCRFAIAQVPPVPTGSFDVVLLLETMLAFEDKDALVREIGAVLGPGGRVAFTLEEGPPLTTAERAAMPDADTVWLTPLEEIATSLERAGLVVTWQEDHSRAHLAMARALAEAFAADASDIDAQIGRRALDELLAAHRLWVEWLDEGRVRKLALVAERAQRLSKRTFGYSGRMPTHDHPLAGRLALVSGATRGCGRATAIELGALGATVYGTGRSTRAGRSPMDRPETIEDTAELVTAAGGEGIAVRCDHTDVDDVGALVERIRGDHARLDILVNDVWGGDPFIQWGKSLWEHPLDATLGALRNGIETHLITSHFAIPLMLEGTGGLVVEVGDGKGDVPYRANMPYDLVKTAVVRMGEALAHELQPDGVTALTVTPGWLRSEAMLDYFAVTEETWREAAERVPYFSHSETPHLLGRGIAALAADPDRDRFAGQCLGSWELMRHYDFTDIDGERPDWGAVDLEARRETLVSGMPEPA